MTVFHTFDFDAQLARVEHTPSGEYLVHTEDFEDINSIIDRAYRTGTEPDFGSKRYTEYDDSELDKAQKDVEDFIRQGGAAGTSDAPHDAEETEASDIAEDEQRTI